MNLKMKKIAADSPVIRSTAKKLLTASLLLLLLLPASCTDETERDGQGSRDCRVTASIENDDASTRVADRNDRTSFTENDPIFIGWSGSTSYKYLCSGTNGVFVPNAADTDRKLWSDLLKNAAATVDVYAWYGTMNSSLPAVGATVSIPQDQASEVKLLSAICMAAHQAASPATNTLNFSFRHLTARLVLSVDIVDDAVTQPDVMDATARITRIYAYGTIATDASNAYRLSVPSDKAGTQSIRMRRSWSDQQIYHLDFECLLPPQTLGEGQSVIITLANGKEYVCKTSGEIALQAGQKTRLSTELKASDDATIKPKLTTIPDATNSAFSGNRLICAIKNPDTGEYRYRVYDKQADGSWGEGVPVYEDEAGTVEFPTQTYSNILKTDPGIEMSRDYVVVGFNADNSLYFIKKSKTTGKWYCANGRLQGRGYGVCISEDFLVGGAHVSSGRSYIYPIDENGELGPMQNTPSGIGAYKCSIYGGILATNTGVYRYNADKGEWDKLVGTIFNNTQRVATDGKRVILQNGGTESDVYIYNVETGKKEEWEGATAKAHQSKPIAIYGNYALAGRTDGINICYRDPATEKWSIVNPDGEFLEIMRHWDPSITITTINGENLSMKGPRAMIVDNKSSQSFFIENIDKMVEDYLKNPY